MNDRVERLQTSLEEPLLVTEPANVRYLSGFESTNAALVVDRERVRLFADFRYAVAGRAVEGVEFVETERALYAGLARVLSGRIGFEREHLTYAGYELLSAAGVDLVPRSGLVERLRAVKDESELDTIRRAAAITSKMQLRGAQALEPEQALYYLWDMPRVFTCLRQSFGEAG